MIDRIKKLIEHEASLSRDWGKQARFARKIGVSEGNVGDWLKGKSSPNEENQRRICAEYGISSRWLASGQGDMFEKVEQKSTEPQPQGQPQKVSGDITIREIVELSRLAGRYDELKDQNEKLENRHKKLLEGLSAALGDYSKMYGPIERMAKTAEEEREALKDEVSKRQRDESQKDPARATEPIESKAPR